MQDCGATLERAGRILVAEDDAATLALLKRQLERAGYEVVACVDGRDAFDRIAQAEPQVILADWLMPRMTGVDLCRAVRQLQEQDVLKPLYIILLTAHGDTSKVVEGLEAGADDYLRKPYDLQELLARIRSGFRISRLQMELLRRQHELCEYNRQLASLNEQLQRLANADPVTELPNRRCIWERLSDYWALCERHDRDLSCIMMDVDHFKAINDTYGHATGDMVLRQMGKILRDLVRRSDICGRFGGEEFLFLCPEQSLEGAAELAERTRLKIAEHIFTGEMCALHITMSLGVAQRSPRHGSPDAMLAEADTMLYAAKAAGRNQVWVAQPDGMGRPLTPLTPLVALVE